jgi:hypothetical protein
MRAHGEAATSRRRARGVRAPAGARTPCKDPSLRRGCVDCEPDLDQVQWPERVSVVLTLRQRLPTGFAWRREALGEGAAPRRHPANRRLPCGMQFEGSRRNDRRPTFVGVIEPLTCARALTRGERHPGARARVCRPLNIADRRGRLRAGHTGDEFFGVVRLLGGIRGSDRRGDRRARSARWCSPARTRSAHRD